jgi:hypothetical protein
MSRFLTFVELGCACAEMLDGILIGTRANQTPRTARAAASLSRKNEHPASQNPPAPRGRSEVAGLEALSDTVPLDSAVLRAGSRLDGWAGGGVCRPIYRVTPG